VPKVSYRNKKTEHHLRSLVLFNYLCLRMHRKPTIEELENAPAYEKVLKLSYNDIATFVINSLKTVSLPMMLIWTAMAVSFVMTIIFWPGVRYNAGNPGILRGLATGLLIIPLLLVPVHELLHLIPYRLAGAKDIRIGSDLRQGIIYVTAHRFVAGLKLFATVALVPFLVITAALAIAIVLSSPWYRWVLTMALFTHTTMCAGDTALLGFLTRYRGRKVYTWDDADSKEAYFYAERETNHVV
jgi:hypothetical protein